jgi:hypothetical protein
MASDRADDEAAAALPLSFLMCPFRPRIARLARAEDCSATRLLSFAASTAASSFAALGAYRTKLFTKDALALDALDLDALDALDPLDALDARADDLLIFTPLLMETFLTVDLRLEAYFPNNLWPKCFSALVRVLREEKSDLRAVEIPWRPLGRREE